jgi:hypothetical protein
MVRKAENYRWSSAGVHCWMKPDPVLRRKPCRQNQFESIDDCAAWLTERDKPRKLEVLRRNEEKCLPYGSEKFIQKLERLT